MSKNSISIKFFLFEILSVFIGISMAFALNRWNEDRKDQISEEKILLEIQNGLRADLIDIRQNIKGHKHAQRACDLLNKVVHGQQVDSIGMYYRNIFRDYISIQNRSGYEALRSNGLQLVENDSLRTAIISLYDFDYEVIEKLEEDYQEMQFFKNYYVKMNDVLSPYMQIDSSGVLLGIRIETISKEDKDFLLSHIFRIKGNREYAVVYYLETMKHINELDALIKEELDN